MLAKKEPLNAVDGRGNSPAIATLLFVSETQISKSKETMILGSSREADGSYAMISDWYACTYPEATNDQGRTGSNAVEGMIKPLYTKNLMKKTLKKNKRLRGFKDISKKNDIITKKDKNGKSVRYARLRYQRT